MQASKIKLGTIYAANSESGGLVRFLVTAVVTKRVNDYGNPHDYESWVEGYNHDSPTEDGRRKLQELSPQAILGPYEEQAELKARAEAEKARAEAENKHKEGIQLELRRDLYAAAGITPPNDDRDYRQPIRASSGFSIDLNWEAVEKLAEYFNRTRRGA